jgi:Ca2+-transporting ATPase
MIILGVLFVLARELGDGSDLARDQTMVSYALSPLAARFQKADRTSEYQTFTSFVFLDLASALQNRGLNVPLLQGNINKMLLLAVSASFLVQLSLIYIPFLQSVFQTQALSGRDLTVLLLLGGCSMSIHEWRRRWERKNAREEAWTQAQNV